ncbi:MAG TPA: hypothetical protein VI229_00115 [Burkholderiales bacterium]
MVEAIFSGQKTQTRRIVSLQPNERGLWPRGSAPGTYPADCTYGAAGDRLWVREAWARTTVGGDEWVVFRAQDNRTDYGGPWKPGIHLRRVDARLVLEITAIRVQRIQDIAYPRDVKAEGVEHTHDYMVLWDKLNAGRAPWMAWSANPWVWVIEFRRLP